MRSSTFVKLALLLTVLLVAEITQSEARGGRRGGSFGGIFGGWRKYKKPAAAGNSRRTTNGSPMHSTVTKTASSGSSAPSDGSASLKATKHHKAQASYPKQHLPVGAGAGSGYHASGHYAAHGAATHLPPGGTYYPNTATIPSGAVYYAQPPIRSSSGTDFLFGMMTGHLLFGHRPHVTHVYQQAAPQATSHEGGRVIIINNGGDNDTATAGNATDAANFWPTDTEVPLAPFNATITPPEQLQPDASQPPEAPQPGGIICVPLLFNETDPNDASQTQHVERTVCYPAPALPLPPPPPPPQPAAAAVATGAVGQQCITRTMVEPDPSDPTQTIEVQQLDCVPETLETATTNIQMPQVAGDIVETVDAWQPQ